MVRVLLADVDPRSRAGWAGLLQAEKDLEVATASATAQLLRWAHRVDVVLLVAGAAAAERVGEVVAAVVERVGTPVVVLTPAGDPHAVASALAHGSAGALVDHSMPAQVVAAIHAAAQRRPLESDTGLVPVTGPLVQRVAHEASPLTDREIEVLALAGDGLSNQEVAERLYLSVSTVKSHLSHVYGRLGVRHRGAAIAEARRRGLIPRR